MRGRGIIVLLVLFVALAGIIYLQDTGTIGTGNETPLTPTPFFNRVYPDLAVSDIESIQLQAQNLSLTITRNTQGEWILSNTSVPLDQELVGQLAASFVLLPFTRTLEQPEDNDLSQFGFRQPPAFLASAVARDSQHAFIIGDFLPSGTDYYALVDDRPGIYIIPRGPIDFLAGFLVNPPILDNETP